MNQDDFDRLLAWLHPDRDEAGKRYEKIRRWLIKIGRARGRTEADAERLADETINRVARKLPEIIDTYEGPPERYFYGVLRIVLIETAPPPPAPPPPAPPPNELEEKERLAACLEWCLKKLPPEDEKLLRDYYAHDGKEKIERRRRLAAELGISENALRIRLTRLRAKLKDCINDCLKRGGE